MQSVFYFVQKGYALIIFQGHWFEYVTQMESYYAKLTSPSIL